MYITYNSNIIYIYISNKPTGEQDVGIVRHRLQSHFDIFKEIDYEMQIFREVESVKKE